jgi:hypothetical protein
LLNADFGYIVKQLVLKFVLTVVYKFKCVLGYNTLLEKL